MVNDGVDLDKYVKLRKSLEAEREKNTTDIRSLKKLLEYNDDIRYAVIRDIDGAAMLGGGLNHRLIEAAEQMKTIGRRAEMDMSDGIEALHRKNRHVEEDIADVEQRYRRKQEYMKEFLKKEGE